MVLYATVAPFFIFVVFPGLRKAPHPPDRVDRVLENWRRCHGGAGSPIDTVNHTGFNGIFMGFHGIFMGFHGISWDVNGIFMGLSWDFMGC